MQPNDIVKFKEDDGILYRIIWIDEPRALIEAQVGMNIKPTCIVNTDEIEPAEMENKS